MKTSYIHDGYTVPGFVEGMPGVYADARFTFRPALAADRTVIRDKIVAAPAREGETVISKTIASRVVEWDLLKPAALGSDERVSVALTLEDVDHVPPTLRNEIFNRLMGDVSPGEAPDADSVRRGEQVDAELEAAMSGSTVEEVTAKN